MSPTTRHYLERSLERAEECRKAMHTVEGGYSYAYGYLKQAVRSLLEADLSSAQTAPTYETLGAEVSEDSTECDCGDHLFKPDHACCRVECERSGHLWSEAHPADIAPCCLRCGAVALGPEAIRGYDDSSAALGEPND